jgi:murein DD-endopeptidase MepM/ murein hydrolase activator NlpD
LGIPARTRLIIISEDTGSSRELGITRAMVLTMTFLLVMVSVIMAWLMFLMADKHSERLQIRELENQLEGAHQSLLLMGELRSELILMQESQEKLLLMLGVQSSVAGEDSLAYWSEENPANSEVALARAAALVTGPSPGKWPAEGFVTREFQKRDMSKRQEAHLGLDIAGAQDTPILAAGDGIVVRTGEDPYLGNYVEIQHGLHYLTVYGHCSRVAVGKGDKIAGGQVVAYMGQSGQASAVHLHFEVWLQGEAINPRGVLKPLEGN